MHDRKNQRVPATAGPTSFPAYLTAQPDGVTLAINLQHRASRNQIAGAIGGELRIRVTAPPVDAAANEALLRLLASTLDCPRGKVELLRGHTARHKVVKIFGITSAAAYAKLDKHSPQEFPSPR